MPEHTDPDGSARPIAGTRPQAEAVLAERPPASSPSARASAGASGSPSAGSSACSSTLLLVPVLPLDDPNDVDRRPVPVAQRPSTGSAPTSSGRDMFARVLWGGRPSLSIGVTAALLGFFIGGLIGVTAGFFRGRYERIDDGGDGHHARVPVADPRPRPHLAAVGARDPAGQLRQDRRRPDDPRHPGPGPHHPGQHARVLPARVRPRRPVARRQAGPDPRPGDPARTCSRRCCRSPSSPSPSSSSPRAPSPSSASRSRRPAVTWGKLIEAGRGDLDKAAYLTLFPCAVPVPHAAVAELHRRQAAGALRRPRRARSEWLDAVITGIDARRPRTAGHLLVVDDLRTSFRTAAGQVRAVDGVSFSLDRGKTLGIVGESGSGKTVLSRSIMGLLPGRNVEVVGHGALRGPRHHRRPRRRRCARSGAPRWRWSSRTR